MKRMILHLKRLFSLYILPPEAEPRIPSGFVAVPRVHYIPAVDEPSVFGAEPHGVNTRWLAWFLKRNITLGYPAALKAVDDIKKGLALEPPRHYCNGYLPPVLVGPNKVISLEWVIWYSYSFGVSFEEAHQTAVCITHRE